jgi:hypothetical protein
MARARTKRSPGDRYCARSLLCEQDGEGMWRDAPSKRVSDIRHCSHVAVATLAGEDVPLLTIVAFASGALSRSLKRCQRATSHRTFIFSQRDEDRTDGVLASAEQCGGAAQYSKMGN